MAQSQGRAGVFEYYRLRVVGEIRDYVCHSVSKHDEVAEDIKAAIEITILHLVYATTQRLVVDGINTVGLLGTRFTMAYDFLKAG